MAVCGIYKITEKKTGKCYIGQSIDIFNRLRQHVSKEYSEDDWHVKLQKYPEQYSFDILVRCAPEDLNDEENYYIYKYNSINNGYNKIHGTRNIFTQKDIEEKSKTPTARIIKPKIKTKQSIILSENERKELYPYTMEDLTNIVNARPQSIYPYMKKYQEFFNKNSIRIHRRKWYSQEALNNLLVYYGKRIND